MERRILGKCFGPLGPPKTRLALGASALTEGLPFGDLGPEVPKYALQLGAWPPIPKRFGDLGAEVPK